MFLRKVWLALCHFRWTVLLLLIGGVIAVYFQVNTLGTFILAAFMGWLQAFLDKVKEIGGKLEQERVANNELASPDSRTTTHQEGDSPKEAQPSVKEVLVDWRDIFIRARATFIGLAIVLALLITITLIYLYIYF